MNILTIASMSYVKLEMRAATLSTKNKVPEYKNKRKYLLLFQLADCFVLL